MSTLHLTTTYRFPEVEWVEEHILPDAWPDHTAAEARKERLRHLRDAHTADSRNTVELDGDAIVVTSQCDGWVEVQRLEWVDSPAEQIGLFDAPAGIAVTP